MILQIDQVFPAAFIEACQNAGYQDDNFSDGSASAGWHARQKKHNLQSRRTPQMGALMEEASRILMSHETIRSAARPRHIVRIGLSRYDSGMSYGLHVDDALMNGQRTDLSFSVFLSAPESYEGGELVIEDPSSEREFKAKSGILLLYPSTMLHRVEPVTRGSRLVLLGWIQSYIRDPAQREILFDLDRSIHYLRLQKEYSTPAMELLLKTRSNLLRQWADP